MQNGTLYQEGLIALVAALLLAAVVRRARTSRSHPDRPARDDMTRLLAVTLIGQVGVLIRARFVERSPAFWISSILLLPVAFLALFLVLRLLRAYRR